MNKKYIHAIIGFAIMLFFRYLPLNIPEVTDVGMQILGIFLGTLYLWMTSDALWSSLLSLIMIAFSDFAPVNASLMNWFGAPVLVQMFFLLIAINILIDNQITDYIARFFLTRKFSMGKPWILTFMILLAGYILSIFVGPFTPIFLLWPVLYSLFKDVGIEKKDKYAKLMVIMVVLVSLIGFPVPPYTGNALALISQFAGVSGGTVLISYGPFFITCFTLGLLAIIIDVLIMRFVFRPDVSKLKNITMELLNKNPLPPMNKGQKFLSLAYVLLILSLLLPSVVKGTALDIGGFFTFLGNGIYAMPIIFVIVASFVEFNGKPLANWRNIMGNFAWPTFFLCATAIYIGTCLTTESTGISACLNYFLSPLFDGMSLVKFSILLLILTCLLTNLSNSLVIGMILEPVIYVYCNSNGMPAAPIVTLMIFFVLSSACLTPSASPFAAMMFGNKEYLTSGEIMKYCFPLVIAELILVLCIGIPMANVLL